MKKLTITILLLLSAASAAMAQSVVTRGYKGDVVRKADYMPAVQYGPRIGLNINTQLAATNTESLQNILNGAVTNPGIELGGFARFNLLRKKLVIYLQPEAMFTLDSYFGKGSESAMVTGFDFMTRLGLGYRLTNDFMVRSDFTPVFGVNTGGYVDTTYDGEGYRAAVKSLMRKEECGWRVNLGADYKKWTMDLHYNNQFKSKRKTLIVEEMRHTQWGFTVGYLF